MAENDPFWMVVGPSGPPTFRHQSKDEAVRESKRLARANPGQDFYVLASIARARVVDVEFTKIDPDELPF